jgi:hypothetical protein
LRHKEMCLNKALIDKNSRFMLRNHGCFKPNYRPITPFLPSLKDLTGTLPRAPACRVQFYRIK